MSIKVEELEIYFIMTCNGESSVAASKYVTYVKGMRAAVKFFKVRGITS